MSINKKRSDNIFTLVNELIGQDVELWIWQEDEEGPRYSLATSSLDQEGLVQECFNELFACDYTTVVMLVNGERLGWFSIIQEGGILDLSDWTVDMPKFIDNALERASETGNNV